MKTLVKSLVVLYGLSAPGWTNALVNFRDSVAESPPPGSVRFTRQCPDPGVQYREIEYLVCQGNTLNSQRHLAVNHRGWYAPNGTGSWGYYPGDGVQGFYNNPLSFSSPVPLPHRVALGLKIAGVVSAEADMQAQLLRQISDKDVFFLLKFIPGEKHGIDREFS
jgi:hypothetical protein